MVMPPCGTFDYVAIVPNHPEDLSSLWAVRPREPVLPQDDSLLDSRLVGMSPTVCITDAGFITKPGPRRPLVSRSCITLAASERKNSTVASASFHIARDLISALLPNDVIYMARTECGGLGLSVIRNGELIVAVGAVTAVTLGRNVQARTPWDLVREAEEVFKSRDPDFQFPELPIEVTIGGHTSLLYRRNLRCDRYAIFMVHGFHVGIPGSDECLALSLVGACPETAANASAFFLDCEDSLAMVQW